MKSTNILVIGGGIGGLVAAIALRKHGIAVEVIERDPTWSVYGVGIIQQSNTVRSMQQLGLVDDYINAGFGYDNNDVYVRGRHVACVPAPKLVPGYPANVGISRPALHKVLGDRAKSSGASIRLGITATQFDDDGKGVSVSFSDGSSKRYDAVLGSDGAYSTTRRMLFPDAPAPEFAGQAVWRYNFPRPAELTSLHAYADDPGVGLVPLSDKLMYMFLTTAEPGNPRYPVEGLAAAMRARLANSAPVIQELAKSITNDKEVVYRPLEVIFLEGPWHRGRIALLGDAVHTTTPHLAQGAGMAIEDAIVVAEELARCDTPEQAFIAYRERRYARCRRLVDLALSVCKSQLGHGPHVEPEAAMKEMLQLVAKPI